MKSFESMYCCRTFIASSHCKVNCFRLYSKLFKFHELIMMELLVVTSVMNMLSDIKFLHQAKTTATITDKICCTFFGNNTYFLCTFIINTLDFMIVLVIFEYFIENCFFYDAKIC